MTEKLVWRLGNVTQGRPFPNEVKGLASPTLSTATVTETLIVHPDRTNTIEVTAYNGAGLLATPPLRIAIDKCAFLLRCVPGTAQEGWIYYVLVVRRSGRQGKALRSVRFCRAIQFVNCQHHVTLVRSSSVLTPFINKSFR